MSSLRVVMVEDNELNAELARDLLELAGHEVTLAADAAAFRALVGEVRADIFLFDLLLPDGDGRELLRDVRARVLVLSYNDESWIELEQFRLLVLQTAWKIDRYQDYKRVRGDISAVKVAMPKVLNNIASRSSRRDQ